MIKSMKYISRFFKNSNIKIATTILVLLLIGVKLLINQFGLEFFTVSRLLTSVISGGTFILGFLLAGVFSDYKEADKMPAEIRTALENIWEDGKMFAHTNKNFNSDKLTSIIKEIIQSILRDLSHDGGHKDLSTSVDALDKLSPIFIELEQLGMPANYVTRLKSERSTLRKTLLRMHHIQRIDFIPSVYFLAKSLVAGIILLLLFMKTEALFETLVLFGAISFLFIYIVRLMPILEQPFQTGHGTKDDVSLFHIKELLEKLN